jgi:NAD(P)-dependent dehydrogenase (short-subunit alcohol dehydrogenase family)
VTELAGAHVLVTGGSRGIGRALAEALADAGSRISLVARSSASVADAARGFGGVGVGVDLSDEEQLFGLVGRIESAAGPIDVLVNNAGVEIHQHLADQSAADVRAALTTNLLSPVELTRQALPGMLARGSGHIVNVSSLAGSAGEGCLLPYSCHKMLW